MEKRETRHYRTLYQVAKIINSTLDSVEVSRAIVRSAAEAIDAKGCSLMLLSPDRQELHHVVSYGLSDRYIQKGPLVVDQTIAEALAGRPVAILHAGTDPRIQYPQHAVREGIASMLTVPVELREETIGALRIYSSKPREFDSAEIEFAKAIANLGAIALDNARCYETVKQDNESLNRYLLEWYALCR